jgi:hypothetical protein
MLSVPHYRYGRLGEDTNILRLPGIEPHFLGLWAIIRPLYGIYDLQKDSKPKPSYATSSFNLHTTCWHVVWHVLWILHSNLPRALFQYCRIDRRPLPSRLLFQPASQHLWPASRPIDTVTIMQAFNERQAWHLPWGAKNKTQKITQHMR